MYKTRRTLIAACALCSLFCGGARACPLCETDTARQVRAGLFDSRFSFHLAVTVLPFGVLGGIVALTHYGLPLPGRRGDNEAAE